MTLQVLVSTMNQRDYSLLDKMNIQSDAIVVNQCDRNEICDFEYKGHKIKWMNLAERGVGLSRNTALMRATADIVLFADDDVVYENNYVQLISDEFKRNSNADLIVFNVLSQNINRPNKVVRKNHKLNYFNYLSYGAFRIACRREKCAKNNICYSLLFGGGAKHLSGEDNLFITDFLHKKSLCIASKEIIGNVFHNESTWFSNFDEKYYYDKGCLFKVMFGKFAKIMLFLIFAKHKDKNYSFMQRLIFGFKGINGFNSN